MKESGVGQALWGAGDIDSRSRFETVTQGTGPLHPCLARACALSRTVTPMCVLLPPTCRCVRA